MDGWTFAAALGVVLCFEFVLLRYYTRSTPTSFDGASEASGFAGPGAGTSVSEHGTDAPGSERGVRAERDGAGTVVCEDCGTANADGPTVVCEDCGTANADGPTVVFCRSCLGRLP